MELYKTLNINYLYNNYEVVDLTGTCIYLI